MVVRMALRKLTALESLWSLGKLLMENVRTVAVIYSGTAHFLAATYGFGVYIIVFAIAALAGMGIILLYLVMKGEIGFRRVLIAQMRTMDRAEFQALRDKYTRLASDIAAFVADQTQSEPTRDYTPFEDRQKELEAWGKRVTASRAHETQGQARFWERFGPRIIDIQVSLKRAGVNSHLTNRPIWTAFTWPESFLVEVGKEIDRISVLYANEDEADRR